MLSLSSLVNSHHHSRVLLGLLHPLCPWISMCSRTSSVPVPLSWCAWISISPHPCIYMHVHCLCLFAHFPSVDSPVYHSRVPFPCPFPVSLSRVPFPCPFPVSLSGVPFPCPFPVSLSRVPFPCPFPVSLSRVPFQCPFPVSLSRVPFSCPFPVSLSSVPFQCPFPVFLPVSSFCVMSCVLHLFTGHYSTSNIILIKAR